MALDPLVSCVRRTLVTTAVLQLLVIASPVLRQARVNVKV